MSQKILSKLKTPRIKSLSLHDTKPILALTLYNGTFIMYSCTDLVPIKTVRVSDLPLRCSIFHLGVLFIGCDDGFIYAFEDERKVSSIHAHSDFIRKLSSHNDTLLSCSDDMSVRQWLINPDMSLSLVCVFNGHTHFVMDVRIINELKDKSSNKSHNVSFITASLDGTVKFWHTDSKKELNTLRGHTDGVNSVTSLGPYMVSVSDDLTTRIWDGPKCIYTIRGHTKNINTVRAFSAFFVTASEDGYVKVYNKKTWKLEFSFNTSMERVWDVVQFNDKLFIGCDEGMVVVKHGRESFCSGMYHNKIYYSENENLRVVKTENVNFVKEVSFLEFVPDYIKVRKNICLGSGGEFYVYHTLGMRLKIKGRGSEFFFINEGFVVGRDSKVIAFSENGDEINYDLEEIIDMRQTSTDQSRGNTSERKIKLVGAKDLSIYAVIICDECLIMQKDNILYSLKLTEDKSEYNNVNNANNTNNNNNLREVLFYEDYVVFIGDTIKIINIDFESVCDFLDQGLEIPEELIKESFEVLRCAEQFFLLGDTLYYTYNSKLYYFFLDDNITEYSYCNIEGKFIGVNENEIIYFKEGSKEFKICKKELNIKFMQWQRKVLKNNIEDVHESFSDRAISFLVSLEMYEKALELCDNEIKDINKTSGFDSRGGSLANTDTKFIPANNRKFELLVKLKRFEDALLVADSKFRFKALMSEFLRLENYTKAAECARRCEDWESLYLINAFIGGCEEEILRSCGGSNLEFLVAHKMGKYERCGEILSGSLYEKIYKRNYK